MILDASRGSMRPLLMMLGLLHSAAPRPCTAMPNKSIENATRRGTTARSDLDKTSRPTIAFIGDSTHRNQLQFLCDVLGTAPARNRDGHVVHWFNVFFQRDHGGAQGF